MSKFRELVEAIVNPVSYVYLTKELQDGIDNEILKTEDYIDPSELNSAHWDNNPYGVEPQLTAGSGMWDYDEDEMWDAACTLFAERVQSDGAFEYLLAYLPKEIQDNYTDEYDEALTKEALDYIEKQKNNK